MILKFCDRRSEYKFVASYILCAVCIQTSLSIFVIRLDLVHIQLAKFFVLGGLLYRGADKYLARPGRIQARKHVRDARDFNNMETRAVIKFFFLQG